MPPRALAPLALLAAVSCGRAPAPSESAARESRPAPPPAHRDAASPPEMEVRADDAAPTPPPGAARRAVVAVSDAEALEVVAGAGGRFQDLVNAEAYRGIIAAVRGDVAAIRREDPRAGVGIRGNAHRLFDTGWLSAGHFELVGLVQRLDRAPQTAEACGDVRLIYRLAYSVESDGKEIASRLPMTAAVVLGGPARAAGGCRRAAERWRPPADSSGAELGAWLVGEAGPLEEALSPDRVARVLTNVQLVRWPSVVHPDLGGHAEYALRAFRPTAGGALEPDPLQAVPDVGRIRGRPELRRRFLAWLRDPETARAADRGEVRLPEALRATVSINVTPRGLSRRANRPYRALVRPAELADLETDDLPRARSPEALLRRLDEQTCAGCHQARTVAGFHFLGEDPRQLAPGNALATPWSAHFSAEISRRRRITDALAAGEAPEFAPPPAARLPLAGDRHGAPCGLGDPGFSDWTCAEGLTCHRYDAPNDDQSVGVCMSEEVSAIGEPCEIGALVTRDDPRRDRVPNQRARPCAEGLVCKDNKQGFPGGLCAAETCEDLPEDAACAVIAGFGFDRCLVHHAFPRCIRENVRPLGVRACSSEVPCRDDYVCAATPEGGGGCVPPYFLFQLRVDGHPPAPGGQRGS